MNLRHAAALALVGWYLISPPFVGDPFYIDHTAQLSEWKIESSYDTAEQCERARKRKSGDIGASLSGRILEPGSRAMMDAALGYLQCVASDDPRLEGTK
jgi:hypothetical protein